MSKPERLSSAEITNAIEKIRKSYDDYIVRYMKSPRIRDGFEDRYLEALKSKTDLTWFVQAEIEAIQGLIGKEEEKRRERSRSREQVKKEQTNRQDFADRVIDEMRKRIEGYPDAPLPEESSYEMKKLFGMLMMFEKEYWYRGDRILRKLSPSPYAEPRRSIEGRVYSLCYPGKDGIPQRCARYVALSSRFPRDYEALDREEKSGGVDAAQLLHTVADEFAGLTEAPGITAEERADVAAVLEFVHTCIEDFRLADFRPKRGANNG